MRLDYWNDPLVVSAFRVRFRGGTPSILAGTYFLGLVTLGGVLHHYLAEEPRYSWMTIYAVCLISIETIVAGLFAMMATWQSMHSEVLNRTLDYQRIAAVPPRDILIGKLLGEPAQGYLMVMAGLPPLIWCWGMGAVPTGVLWPLLAQVATTAFLLGTLGLVHPLDVGGDRTKLTSRTVRNVALVIVGIYVMQMTIFLPFMTGNPLTQVPLGVLTPVFGIAGFARGEPLQYGLPFFRWELPYLYLTPITQITIATVILHAITRRIISPMNVALSKPAAYAIVAALDVVAAGVMFDLRTMPYPLDVRVATFSLIHLVITVMIVLTITPGRECLRSWVWRFRGRRAWWWDVCVGERSENVAALAIFCLLGFAAAVLLVLLPDIWQNQASLELLAQIGANKQVLLSTCLLILALGTVYQLLVSIGSAGPTLFVGALTTIVAMPHLLGAYLESPILMAMSPSAQFTQWIGQVPPQLPWWPLLATYGIIFVFARTWLVVRLRTAIQKVDRTIVEMKAEQAENLLRPLTR